MALDHANASAYDVLLLDARMPNLGGAEVLARIRAQAGPSQHAIALATTADNDRATHAALRASGFADVLTKPLSIDAADDAHSTCTRFSACARGPPRRSARRRPSARCRRRRRGNRRRIAWIVGARTRSGAGRVRQPRRKRGRQRAARTPASTGCIGRILWCACAAACGVGIACRPWRTGMAAFGDSRISRRLRTRPCAARALNVMTIRRKMWAALARPALAALRHPCPSAALARPALAALRHPCPSAALARPAFAALGHPCPSGAMTTPRR